MVREEQEARSPPSQAQKALLPDAWPAAPAISKGLIKRLVALSPPHAAQRLRLGEQPPGQQHQGAMLLCWVKVFQAPPGPSELALSGCQTAAIPAGPARHICSQLGVSVHREV